MQAFKTIQDRPIYTELLLFFIVLYCFHAGFGLQRLARLLCNFNEYTWLAIAALKLCLWLAYTYYLLVRCIFFGGEGEGGGHESGRFLRNECFFVLLGSVLSVSGSKLWSSWWYLPWYNPRHHWILYHTWVPNICMFQIYQWLNSICFCFVSWSRVILSWFWCRNKKIWLYWTHTLNPINRILNLLLSLTRRLDVHPKNATFLQGA